MSFNIRPPRYRSLPLSPLGCGSSGATTLPAHPALPVDAPVLVSVGGKGECVLAAPRGRCQGLGRGQGGPGGDCSDERMLWY